MRAQEQLMREAGYITASEAAEAIGANLGTVHRMVQGARLVGTRVGYHWYVLVKSLVEAYKDAPPILERILALGVEPKDPPRASGNGAPSASRVRAGGKGRGRARRA